MPRAPTRTRWREEEARDVHRPLKQSIPAYIRAGTVLNLLTAPLIYSLLVPFVIVDVWTLAYQWICFPIYGIPRVARPDYFALDRRKLPYLNGIERLNCSFCGYANGVIAFVREVAARTEQYWCPIKHAHAVPTPHSRYHLFADYGDARGYRHGLAAMRRARPRRAPVETKRTKDPGAERGAHGRRPGGSLARRGGDW